MAVPRLVVGFDFSQVEKGEKAVRQKVASMVNAQGDLDKSSQKLTKEQQKLNKEVERLAARLDPATRAWQIYERRLALVARAADAGKHSQEQLNRMINRARAEFDKSTSAVTRHTDSIFKLAASYISIRSAINVVRQLMDAQMELERVQARLRVASGGSSALAASTYKELSNEAKRLGLDLNSLANSYSKLAVASRGTSLEGKATKEIFLGVSEASAALGLSADQTEGALRAIEQMMSKGTVQAEELRGQLGERLPGAFNMAAKAMGVTTFELNDMLKKGEVLAVDLLPKLAQELRNTYGAEAATNADRLTGATNNLSTAWTELKNAINEAGMGDTFIGTLKLVTEAINGVTGALGFFDKALKDANQGSLLENINRFTVLNALLKAHKRIKEELILLNDMKGVTAEDLGPLMNRRYVKPISRYEGGHPLDQRESRDAMMDALKASAKGFEDAEKAADKYAKSLDEIARRQEKIVEHEAAIAKSRAILSALPTLDELIAVPDIIPYGPVIKGMSDAEKRAKAWSDEMELVTKSLEGTADAAIDAAFGTDQFFDSMNQKHIIEEFETELKKLEADFADFKKEVSENFIRGVQSSLSTFFYEVMDSGEDALKNFGKALKDLLFKTLAEYLAQWAITQAKMLALSLKRIAAEKAAAEAAGVGSGSGDSKSGGGWWASILKAFKGGGGGTTTGAGLSGGAIAGVAVFAVMAAAIAYFRHRRSERDKERYGTNVDMAGYGGSLSSGFSGRLTETGAKVAEAMQMLTLTIQESARAYIDGAMNATVKIRNDKKSFQALVDGELVGTFRTANEAVLAAIKTMFLKKADLDPVIRQVLENNTATDPEGLGSAVAYVQGILDEIKGITQVEATLQALPGKIRAMVGDLQLAGVEFSNAITMAHQWGLAQFRGAWDSISGQQRSPEEERAHRERQRELLLDQMKLERIKLQQDLAVLKARAAIVKGGAGLARQEMLVNVGSIRGRAALLEAEADITSAQFGVWGNYLDGRVQFVEAEAGLYAAEIALLEKTLADLDALIKEVESTPIRLGGGRGSGGLGDVIGGAGRFGGGGRLITALERLISAVDKLREFQKSLAQDEQLTPYGVQQRFGMAQAQFQNVSAAAQQGKVWAIEMLPDVARQYLELASQMYGTAGAGYGGIFEQVNQILQAISDQYPSGTDPQAWMRSGMESVNRYLAAIRGDGNRRAEQHDETNSRLRDSNRKMDDLIDAVERQGNALDRIVSTGGTRPGMGGPRQGNGNFRAA